MNDREKLREEVARAIYKGATSRDSKWDAVDPHYQETVWRARADAILPIIEREIAAAARPMQGEPVAWLYKHPVHRSDIEFGDYNRGRLTEADKADGWTEAPLYAHHAPPMPADVDTLQARLKTVLDREAETHRRHDAKLDRLQAREAVLVEALSQVKELTKRRQLPLTHQLNDIASKAIEPIEQKEAGE